MDYTYYLFALFVFLLVCAAIWFFSKIYKGAKKEETNDYAKEQRLYKLYQNVEDMMTSFEEYVEQSKAELDQKLSQIERILEKPESITEQQQEVKNTKAAAKSADHSGQKAAAAVQKSKQNTEKEIAQMVAEGMDINDIAKSYGMSSKQVSLIMEINKLKDSRKYI